MGDTLDIEIAGVVVSVAISDPRARRIVADYYEDFLTSGRDAEIEVRVEIDDFTRPAGAKNLYSTANWSLRRRQDIQQDGHQDGYELFFHDLPETARRASIARIDGDLRTVAFTSQDPTARHLNMPFLSILLSMVLGRGEGAMVHAAGVVDGKPVGIDGKEGILLVGPSGVGKSTFTKLCGDRVVLNDERIIVRRDGPGFVMYGNPWHGDDGRGSPVSAPVKKVFFLSMTTEGHLICPVDPVEACRRLMENCFIPLRDVETLGASLQLFSGLAETVPCYKLGYEPSSTIWGYLSDYFSRGGPPGGEVAGGLRWPVPAGGPLRIRPYGVEQFTKEHRLGLHRGVDLLLAPGTPVRAAAPGRARIQRKRREMFMDRSVRVECPEGLAFTYRHLSEISVEEGRPVTAGEVIGRSGDLNIVWERRLVAPHLHFEIEKDGNSVDPLDGYFSKEPGWRFIDNRAMLEPAE